MATVKPPATTEDEIARAIAAGRRRQATERRAVSVRYDPKRDSIEIELADGVSVRLPRAMIEEFRDVPRASMTGLRISPAGYGIRLDTHDINISVQGLIAALVAPGELAARLGRLGGAVRSDAKRTSARANGAKGGRPRKVARAG